MSNSQALGAPGSGSYTSNTMHVGDGTWDSDRNNFLLPPLMGLNFETMRYNGMGNRFRDLPDYHRIVTAHGILAAMTFLFIVPAAIFMARFYYANQALALRAHIWLQILTVLFSTVILTLGWFAVGPQRSLTNPHHGIGVAIYVLIMFQALWGWLVRRMERGRTAWKLSMKLMIHQWVGRGLALLAIAQVALGLTLYGSPKTLFILYAVWVAILIFAWFYFSWQYQPDSGDGYSSYYGGRTDYTDETRSRKGHGFLGPLAAGGLAAAALSRLGRRRQSEEKTHTDVSSHHDGSHRYDDRYSESNHHDHTWRNRILAAGAGLGAIGLARKFFGGRKDEASDVSYSQPSETHRTSYTDVSRVEEGLGPSTPDRHGHRPGMGTAAAAGLAGAALGAAAGGAGGGSPHRPPRRHNHRSGDSVDSYDSESFYSPGKEKRKTHNFRDAIATMGAVGYLRHKLGQRQDRKGEEQRVQEMRRHDRRTESIVRHSSRGGRRYTGDGRPHRRHGSFSESEMTPLEGSTPALSRHNLRPGEGLAAGAAGAALGAAAMGAGSHHHSSHSVLPPPPRVVHDSSGSEAYTSAGGTRRHRHRNSEALAAGAAAAGLGAAASDNRRRRSSVNSPPLSIKMRLRNEGGRQQVTLRRLNPEEAAAERAARRRRGSSVGSAGGASDEHWRRVEAREAAQAAEMRQGASHNIPPPGAGMPPPPGGSYPPPPPGPPPPLHSSSPLSNLPPPPPIPGASYSNLDSPGYGTDSVADSRADSNRRRRRAERARAEAAAREGRGARVEFE